MINRISEIPKHKTPLIGFDFVTKTSGEKTLRVSKDLEKFGYLFDLAPFAVLLDNIAFASSLILMSPSFVSPDASDFYGFPAGAKIGYALTGSEYSYMPLQQMRRAMRANGQRLVLNFIRFEKMEYEYERKQVIMTRTVLGGANDNDTRVLARRRDTVKMFAIEPQFTEKREKAREIDKASLAEKWSDSDFVFYDYGAIGEAGPKHVFFIDYTATSAANERRSPQLLKDIRFPTSLTKSSLVELNTSQSIGSSSPDSSPIFALSCFVSFQRGLVEHPYWIGTGDHVNSHHQLDLYLQFARLLCHEAGILIPDDFAIVAVKSVQLKKFVELDALYDFQLQSASWLQATDSNVKSLDKITLGAL